MLDNSDAYNFIELENEEGTDYLFLSEQKKGIYTVSFNSSGYTAALSEQFSEHLPVLSINSFGLIFSFQRYHNDDCCVEETRTDDKVRKTIIDIINHFLKSQPKTTFLVYECIKSKQRVFNTWFKEFKHNQNMLKGGLIIEIDEDWMYFGFLTRMDNPRISDANKEIDRLSILLMQSNF